MVYAALLFNVVLLVAGQIVWKIGLEKSGGFQLENALHVLLSPLILLGILIYGLATVVWLYVLSRLPLSFAYPLQSFAYVLALLVAFAMFKESIPPTRWIGAFIIMAGIAVVSWK
ncbi:EamA family transporter [Cohnella sp. CFH 77786]|uniref:EamA family transporter n=1 Tax=Cohnella sp. CFH 77786 TaxID=2662265 RepID=UPI001C60C925|nr:EamA family transporter [Cohnella sp. CFH 77786]MBW5445510.1 EamA family transporter [Cohnella sp. CFH 77786]